MKITQLRLILIDSSRKNAPFQVELFSSFYLKSVSFYVDYRIIKLGLKVQKWLKPSKSLLEPNQKSQIR